MSVLKQDKNYKSEQIRDIMTNEIINILMNLLTFITFIHFLINRPPEKYKSDYFTVKSINLSNILVEINSVTTSIEFSSVSECTLIFISR